MHKAFEKKECKEIDEFWELLSPENPLRTNPSKFIFRGLRSAKFSLLPRIFRNRGIESSYQIFIELNILRRFVEHCDSMGLRIINDSMEFRKTHLNARTADKYYLNPSKWPNRNLLELMALAQHHGVPTRLLDWSKRSYVAAYFAASSALKYRDKWEDGERLAIWAFDKEYINLYKNISIVKVPGAVSKNVSAQAGVFTLQRQKSERGKPNKLMPLEMEFTDLPNTPLYKITIPVSESKNILEFCELYGVTASTLFPGFDGAAKAVKDSINCWDEFDILGQAS